MAKLEDLLRQTLTSAPAGFPASAADLQQEAAELDAAVRKLTENTLTVSLREARFWYDLMIFELGVAYRGEDERPVAAYALPASGYPIQVIRSADFDPATTELHPIEVLNARPDLLAHFERMVTDRRHPLVQYVSFARQQLREDRRLPEQAPVG